MRHTKRAVDSTAVTNFNPIIGRPAVLCVAPIAEPVRAEAVPHGYRAAEHAFPIDVPVTVLLADFLTCAVSLHLTVFAPQVLLFDLLLHIELRSAVDHATEVRLLTVEALVESAGVHS